MAVFLGKLTIYLYFCAINIKTEQSRMFNTRFFVTLAMPKFLDEPSEINFEFSVSDNLK